MNRIELVSPSASALAFPAPELSVVIPTFNEQPNLPILVDRLERALVGIKWEIIFVDDDSPDGTATIAKAIGELHVRVRCIRRVG